MNGMHPQFLLSKRFPVHTAIEQHNIKELLNLLQPVADAKFHFNRRLTNTDVSVLHQACAARSHCGDIVVEVVKLLVRLGTPINDLDCIGQTPLFYAVSHSAAVRIVPILLQAGAEINIKRKSDGWTPLFVAAMMGSMEVVTILLQAGANASIEDFEDKTAEHVALRYGQYSIADILNSPRSKCRPKYPSQFADFLKTSSEEDSNTILWDEHLDWRDEDGCTLLHIAAWTGNLELFKSFCSDAKGRKLLAVSTAAGLSPLAYAIINQQNRIVEEYFINKCSKKLINFQADIIKETKQTIAHLLLQFAPGVHPKYILKRKDLTSEIMNAVDNKGNTPLLYLAARNSRDTLRRLLSSKAATERHLFSLGIQNKYGKTVLHYLIQNNDKHNLRLFLNLLEDAGDAINSVDIHNMSPIRYCVQQDRAELATIILNHTKSRNKINLSLADKKGRTLLHLAAEKVNMQMFNVILSRDASQMNFRDCEGNTPLMTAAAGGNSEIINAWLDQYKNAPQTGFIQQSTQNCVGENLLMIVIQNLEEFVVKKFIDTIDLTESMDEVDKDGDNALLIAANLGKWNVLNWLLTNDKSEDVAFNVHPIGKGGSTVLVLALMARARLARKEQTHRIKCEKELEKKVHEENEALWVIVTWVLYKEKGLHGSSHMAGKEAGIECLKKQMEVEKGIRPPVPDEVIQEFTDLYKFKMKPKKKPAVVVDPIKPMEQMPTISSMQQKMNDILKNAPKKEESAQLDKLETKFAGINNGPEKKMNGTISAEENNESPPIKKSALDLCIDRYAKDKRETKKEPSRQEPITNGTYIYDRCMNTKGVIDDDLTERMNEEVMWAIQEKKRVKEEDDPISQINTNELKKEIEVEEPNIDDIRSQWKKNRKKDEETKKVEEFNPKTFMEEMAQKAAEKARLAASVREKPPDREFEERMNEEMMWVQKEQERLEDEAKCSRKEKEEKNKQYVEDGDALTRFLKQTGLNIEKDVKEESFKSQPSLDNMFQNIEAKLQEKAERKAAIKAKSIAEENKVTDDDHLAERIDEEFVWALQQKQMLTTENQEIKDYESLKNGTKRKEDIEEEKRQKLMRQKEYKEQQEREEQQRLEKAKEEKERLEKLEEIVQAKLALEKEKADAERKQKEDEELKRIMDEEMHWALQEKRRLEQEKIDREKKEKVRKEKEVKDKAEHEAMLKRVKEREEKAAKEKERLKNAQLEKETIAKLEQEIKLKKEKEEREQQILRKKEQLEKEMLEKEQKDAEANKMPKWKRDKLEREKLEKNKEKADIGRKQREDEDIKRAMDEEVQWALQEKKRMKEETVEKGMNNSGLKEVIKNKEHEDMIRRVKEREEKKEQEKLRKANMEKEQLENELKLKKETEEKERLYNEKLEKQKKETEESNIPTWKRNILSRQKSEKESIAKEREKKEAEELENGIKEELRWAEEAKIQQQKDIEAENIRQQQEKERLKKEKEKAEQKLRQEQERLNLEQEEHFKKEEAKIKEEESARKKKEMEEKEAEIWAKMPLWKKQKLEKQRKESNTSNADLELDESKISNANLKIDQINSGPSSIKGKDLTTILTLARQDSSPGVDEDLDVDKFTSWLATELNANNKKSSEKSKEWSPPKAVTEPPEYASPAPLESPQLEIKPPVRRKRRPTGEDPAMDVSPLPTTRAHRKSKVEEPCISKLEEQSINKVDEGSISKAEEPSISDTQDCDDGRHIGVGVETRPGYWDVGCQTDPVQTTDMGC